MLSGDRGRFLVSTLECFLIRPRGEGERQLRRATVPCLRFNISAVFSKYNYTTALIFCQLERRQGTVPCLPSDTFPSNIIKSVFRKNSSKFSKKFIFCFLLNSEIYYVKIRKIKVDSIHLD